MNDTLMEVTSLAEETAVFGHAQRFIGLWFLAFSFSGISGISSTLPKAFISGAGVFMGLCYPDIVFPSIPGADAER